MTKRMKSNLQFLKILDPRFDPEIELETVCNPTICSCGFSLTSLEHDAKWAGYTKLHLGVIVYVHDALPWTGFPFRVYSNYVLGPHNKMLTKDK